MVLTRLVRPLKTCLVFCLWHLKTGGSSDGVDKAVQTSQNMFSFLFVAFNPMAPGRPVRTRRRSILRIPEGPPEPAESVSGNLFLGSLSHNPLYLCK